MFLLDFFEGQIFARPFDFTSFAFLWGVVFDYEPFLELFVLNIIVFVEGKYNGEIVSSFLVINTDVLDKLKKIFVISSHTVLDDAVARKAF